MRPLVSFVAVILAVAACSRPGADLVLLNGNVITVDATDRIAHAEAVAGNRIVAVGTDDEIRAHVGPATRQIDLHGMTVTPGLLDAHSHFASGGLDRRFVLDLS